MIGSCFEFMDSVIKSIVRQIAAIQPNESIVLGDLAASVLFSPNHAALVVDHNAKRLSLLSTSEKERNCLFRLLVSVLSEINNLSNSSLVFLSTPPLSGLSVFYAGKTNLSNTQDPDLVDLGDDISLSFHDHHCCLTDKEELNGDFFSHEIYEMMVPVFCSRVYPGFGLYEYIKDGFKTKELKIATRAYHISIIAIIVAILLCLVSPLVSDWLGDNTLDSNQFQQILNAINSIQ